MLPDAAAAMRFRRGRSESGCDHARAIDAVEKPMRAAEVYWAAVVSTKE